MRILVIGGMHGNEPLGVELVKLLELNPIDNVETMIANPDSIVADRRFIETDLNRSFPGDPEGSKEQKLAPAILKRAERYDLVLDFHNTRSPDNDSTFVGAGCESFLRGVSEYLELNNQVVATYECINKYALNCISIEISLDSKLNSAKYWAKQIKKLAGMQKSDFPSGDKVDQFEFVGRVMREQVDLVDADRWLPFQAMAKDDAQALGYKDRDIYPIFIASTYTDSFATLVRLM